MFYFNIIFFCYSYVELEFNNIVKYFFNVLKSYFLINIILLLYENNKI